MPCFRCGARQSDPSRGASLWVRGVRADEQVLVCPDCQQTRGWSTDLDHCSTCGATTLVRRLGQTVCRSCEASATAEFLAVESTTDRGVAIRAAEAGRHRRIDNRDLSADVATAIDRVLGRAPSPPSPPSPPSSPDGDRSHPATTATVVESDHVPPRVAA